MEDAHKNLLNEIELRKYRDGEGHSLLGSVSKFLSVLPTLTVRFGENQYKRSAP
jgi:hypothetical protein